MMKLLIAPLLLLLAQEPPEDRLRALVNLLGADELEVREQAARDLIGLGVAAIPGLEKIAAALPEGEVLARSKSILQRLRRLAKVAEVAPPLRRVTISARDSPLRRVLEDISRQSGTAVECSESVADRPVTIEIAGEPMLQAVDRVCHARGDLVSTLGDGKVKVAGGTPAAWPAAYVDGFRLRLRKRLVVEAGDFGKSRTDILVHAVFDAQPDQKYRTVLPLPGSAASGPEGAPVSLRSAGETAIGTWISTGVKNIAYVDDVMVMLEDGDALELVFYIKDAPADLKKVDSLKVKARYRFPVGVVAATAALSGPKRSTLLGELPYYVHMGGRNLYIYTSPRPGQPAPPLLQDLIETETLAIVDASGKENKLTLQPQRGSRSMQYMYLAERDLKDEEMTLKYNVLDAVDREVEFELRDVKLRN